MDGDPIASDLLFIYFLLIYLFSDWYYFVIGMYTVWLGRSLSFFKNLELHQSIEVGYSK